MCVAFLNSRGWNEGKWRTLVEGGKDCDVIAVGETGWRDYIEWQEGEWIGIGRGRKVGEKKGGGVGVIMKRKEGRDISEVCMEEELKHLNYNKGDI